MKQLILKVCVIHLQPVNVADLPSLPLHDICSCFPVCLQVEMYRMALNKNYDLLHLSGKGGGGSGGGANRNKASLNNLLMELRKVR